MYKVVKFFTDLQDNKHPYNVGDIFPREGVEVSEDRLKELSTDKNKRGAVLIEEVVEDTPADESEEENDSTEVEIPADETEESEDEVPTDNTEEDIPEESLEDAKEEPLEKKADVDSPKKPKAKKTPKKA